MGKEIHPISRTSTHSAGRSRLNFSKEFKLNAIKLLQAGQDASWNIKKGAVWWFPSRTLFGSNGCVLRAVVSPDLL